MSGRFTLTPKEFRAKWVEALRSGRFKQGMGSLAQESEGQTLYCCLGVACEVYRENGGALSKRKDTFVSMDGVEWEYGPGHDTAGLPTKVARALGISDTADLEDETAVVMNKSDLADVNDAGVPFEDIARIIEQNQIVIVKE